MNSEQHAGQPVFVLGVVEQGVDLVEREAAEPFHHTAYGGHLHSDEDVAVAVLARARLEVPCRGQGRVGAGHLGERRTHVIRRQSHARSVERCADRPSTPFSCVRRHASASERP